MEMNRFEVLFFDVNETLLDLTEVRHSVSEVLQGGDEVVDLWFETMLHYSLVANASDEYHNFGEIGAAALIMTAGKRGIKLNYSSAREALKPIRTTPPYPEVIDALKQLKDFGYRMAALTNSPRTGMEAQLEHAGIDRYFDQSMSVEDIGIYKPRRHVYRWAARQMKADVADCLFIAAHGWDVAGAMAAGMQAAFIARPGQHLYPLAPEPSYVEKDLKALAQVLT